MTHGFLRSPLACDHESWRQKILEPLMLCPMATRDPGWLVTVSHGYKRFWMLCRHDPELHEILVGL